MLAGLFSGGVARVAAHDLITVYLQHQVVVGVGSLMHVDVTIQLTSFARDSVSGSSRAWTVWLTTLLKTYATASNH
jgi:hypothetical protein